MIRTFLFDMGNVLVHFSHERMCEQIGALVGRSAEQIKEFLFESELQWQFERGMISEEELHQKFLEYSGFDIDFDALVHAGSDIFQLNEPMPGILDALKKRGHRLVLLSNTSVSHFEFVMREYNVLQKFDNYCTSYQAGAIKPEPAIFEAAGRLIDCEAGECFYTDDMPEYVEIGRSLGWQAEVFTDAASLVSQLQGHGIDLSSKLSD